MLHKRDPPAERTSPPPSLDPDFERALVALLESSQRAQLIAAGRRLVHVLAPGSQLGLTEVGTDGARRNGDAGAGGWLTLPLGETARHALKVSVPAGLSQGDVERRIALVARLLGAKDDQLQSLHHLRDSVHRLERAERLQRALYTISDQASSDRNMADVLATIHRIIGSLMYAENFFIVHYDRQSETLRFPYFVDVADPNPPAIDRAFPLATLAHSPTWYVLQRGVSLMGGVQSLAAQVRGPLAYSGPAPVDWLGVPLLHEDGAVGAIVVQSYREDARYKAQDRTLLSYVAQHVRTALERRRAHEELGRRVAERTEALTQANRDLQRQVLERQRGERLQTALFRIAELASTSDSLDTFYAAVHQVVGGLLYARNFFIALLDEDGETLRFPYSRDEFDTIREPRKRGHGLTEHILDHGTALLADSDAIQRLHQRQNVEQSGAPSICWLGVPLICDERAVGVLVVQSYSAEHRYTRADQELLTFVSYHIANALQRKRSAESLKQANTDLEQRVDLRTRSLAKVNRDLRQQIIKRERIEQRLKYETLHDSLTGLPNRSLLLRRLGSALERYHADPTQLFAVLFLDLDRFKVINDSVGHLIGDDLLFQVGGRIRACLKAPDVVARLGGDEFAVLLENINGTDAARQIAARVIAEINRPFRLGTKEVFTATSIGIALVTSHYRRAEELLRDADAAMYQAKAEGRQRYALFDERLRHRATTQLELENDLRRALTRDEFEPWFQPIVRIDDASVVGYESLLRWRHPERGVLEPDEFLRTAEENGSAEQIDWQMFAHVLEQAPKLLTKGRFITINLSGHHFHSHDLERRLLELLARHRVDPHAIRIEVTERALLDNPAHVKRTLENLGRHGVVASLDDFGTGYSSLSYLHQYPLKSLKIDRSFVTAMADDNAGSTPVVRAIQLLADSLGMLVIAEGIETEHQRATLAAMHCPLGQGFLFGRPAPASHWL